MEETGRRPETDDAIRMALAEVDLVASALSSPDVASLAQRLRTAAATIRYGIFPQSPPMHCAFGEGLNGQPSPRSAGQRTAASLDVAQWAGLYRRAQGELHHEVFSKFLASIKRLNASTQLREHACREARAILEPSLPLRNKFNAIIAPHRSGVIFPEELPEDCVQCLQVRGIGGDDVAPLAWHPSAPESLKDLVAQAVGVPANAVHLLLGSEEVTPDTQTRLSSRQTSGVPSKPLVLTLVVDPECKQADDPLSVEASGKLFFEKARRELSTQEYSQFLGIIQRLQQSCISREDALEGARRIFGPGKVEMHDAFESLILLHRM